MSQAHSPEHFPGESSSITFAHVNYLLLVLGLLVGVTSFIAVIIAYLKVGDVRGHWLESHFRWQITTFWVTLLFSLVGIALTLVLVGYLVLFITWLWAIYRIVKGWMRLVERRALF